jgi:hypothetical protein
VRSSNSSWVSPVLAVAALADWDFSEERLILSFRLQAAGSRTDGPHPGSVVMRPPSTLNPAGAEA